MGKEIDNSKLLNEYKHKWLVPMFTILIWLDSIFSPIKSTDTNSALLAR